MPKGKKTSWKKWLYGAAVAVLAFAAALLILAYIFTGDTIRKGIRIEQTDVSWMTAADAREQLARSIETSFPADKITLTYGDRQWDLPLADIDYRYSVEEAVEKAYSVARNGNLFQKVFRSVRLLGDNLQFPLETSYDREKLRSFLAAIGKECEAAGKNAEVHYEKGEITIARETNGTSLDIDRNAELVDNQLRNKDFAPVELQVDVKEPPVTYEKIREIKDVLSRFSTRFNPGDVNRSDNIRLACSRLNGIVLLPGEELSMNKALGPRTLENGYKEAPVIIKNELTDGTGGGVCQVSSTLYNTVLLAGLDVTERMHHSIPLTYISPGRDATITEDSIDFRFVNSQDYPVCLQAEVAGDTVIIRLLGKKSGDSRDIKLVTETLAVYSPEEDEIIPDDSLPAGERIIERKAAKGLRVVLFKEVYRDGTLSSRERLTEDYYKPIRGKVRLSRDLYETYLATR
jgi:vancomycin resistance protein YoaR